jgi:hypothetical protein
MYLLICKGIYNSSQPQIFINMLRLGRKEYKTGDIIAFECNFQLESYYCSFCNIGLQDV